MELAHNATRLLKMARRTVCELILLCSITVHALLYETHPRYIHLYTFLKLICRAQPHSIKLCGTQPHCSHFSRVTCNG